VDRRAAGVTVAEIDAIRAAGRRRLATASAPLAAFGLVDLGAVPVCALVGRFHIAPYAVPAFVLALWWSARAVRRGACTAGVQVSMRPWAVTAAALCVAGIGASRTGYLLDIEILSAVGPFLAQATGLWLLGRWADSSALVAISILMVLGSALIGAAAAGDLAVTLQFGLYGALLLAAAGYTAKRTAST
jgi:hypothetical protein